MAKQREGGIMTNCTSWRPKGWKKYTNTTKPIIKFIEPFEGETVDIEGIFEAGANALLESLRKNGNSNLIYTGVIGVTEPPERLEEIKRRTPGVWVFIPDDKRR